MSETEPFTYNGHLPEHVGDVADTLPADLEAIHARLTYESDGWTRRLPAAEPLASYARSLAGGIATVGRDMPDGANTSPLAETFDEMDTMTRARAKQQTRRPSRGRVLLGVAAAVVIVALMAAVFTSLAPGRGPATGKPTAALQPTSTPLPTATPRPAFGPIHGSWQAVPGLTDVPGPVTAVTIAPSNPRVIYETLIMQAGNGEPVGQYAILRRSDDEGKTWHNLTPPKPTDSSVTAWAPGEVIVSPADSNTLLVSIDTQLSYNVPTPCPADLTMAYRPQTAGSSSASKTLSAALPLDGFQRCSVQYASSDSGAHWMKVEVAGFHSSLNGILSLAAQGDRLYGTVYADDQQGLTSGYRIITSTDGIHWQTVDASLLSQVKHICGFVATSIGSTLFANTNSGECSGGLSHADELWRSGDDGATWRDLGPLGGYSIMDPLAVAEQGPYDALPTLYAYTLDNIATYDLKLKVSTDGGYTWQTAPTAGLPAGYTPYVSVAGTLSDGSVVVILTSNWRAGPHDTVTLAFYAWHAGDSEWHQVAPNLPFTSNEDLTDGWNSFLVTPNGGVHGTLWHTQYHSAFTGSTSSVTRYSS